MEVGLDDHNPPAHTQHALSKGGKKFQDSNKKENNKKKKNKSLASNHTPNYDT